MSQQTRRGYVILFPDGDVIYSSQEASFNVWLDRPEAEKFAHGSPVVQVSITWDDGIEGSPLWDEHVDTSIRRTTMFATPSETYFGIYQLPNGKWSFAEDNVTMNDQQCETEEEAVQWCKHWQELVIAQAWMRDYACAQMVAIDTYDNVCQTAMELEHEARYDEDARHQFQEWAKRYPANFDYEMDALTRVLTIRSSADALALFGHWDIRNAESE